MTGSVCRLNFARSWRPRFFREVVGQVTPVQLLANSVAREIYFPAYLLSGMRGSGKTTVGRLFAAALNCECLGAFCSGSYQWHDLPCGACRSCQLMQRGEHPDFVEVDAASYTGVENIRQIMDEAQFLPVVGRKKVYLVDEAHMLSKSAFNAFLKMLEEPPASVVFLLATTEVHKILDTVRSRSFQLFFDPLPFDVLANYLMQVAQKEGIACEAEAALLLAQQGEGSVRDALTSLEQAWVAGSEKITVNMVRGLFGLVSFATVFELYRAIFALDAIVVFEKVSELAAQRRSLFHGWQVLVEVASGCLWYEKSILMPALEAYKDDLVRLVEAAPQGFFARALDLFFKYEPLLQKTQHQIHLFERMMVGCLELVGNGVGAVVPKKGAVDPVYSTAGVKAANVGVVSETKNQSCSPTTEEVAPVELAKTTEPDSLWGQFLVRVRPLCKDPILFSVFSSGHFQVCEEAVVRVLFPKSFAFYQDLLLQSRSFWQPVLDEVFGCSVTLVPSFSGGVGGTVEREKVFDGSGISPAHELAKKKEQVLPPPAHKKKQARGVAVDIADANAWPNANVLVGLFPGSVKLYEE